MASNVGSKKKTAAEKLAAAEAAIAAEEAAHAEKIARRKAAVVKAQEEAAREAERAAKEAERQASMASFGMLSIPKKKRMTAAERLEMLMAANSGSPMVNNTAAAKATAAAAFEALSASEKVRYLEAKAASDIAAAEQRLADFKQRVTAKLARDIADVHKKSGSMNSAAVVLNAAFASSSSVSSPAASSAKRRTTQQVYNNTIRELNKERTRKAKKERGNRNYTPSPPRRRTSSTERIAKLEKAAAESLARLEKQGATARNRETKKAERNAKAAANKIALARFLANKAARNGPK